MGQLLGPETLAGLDKNPEYTRAGIDRLYCITNAPSIQMIQQLLGSPVVYQFYDMRFFVCEASFPPPPPVLHNFLLVHNLLPQYTLIFWRKLCNTGGGGNSIV